MSAPAGGSGPVGWGRRWLAGRTLRSRLIAGVSALLAVVFVAVGLTTSLALHGVLVNQLDQQLSAAGLRLSIAIEHAGQPPGPGGPGGPDDLSTLLSEGQAVGTFAARTVGGQVSYAVVVQDNGGQVGLAGVPLSAADVKTLLGLPANGRPYTRDLSSLGAYRLIAGVGNGDVHVAGLSLGNVDRTVNRVDLIEIVVFAAALLLTGLAGTGWVRLTLRPLRRMTATATEVTRLPLASGEVMLPHRVPDADPRTEVGQLGSAFNRMLGHVEAALGHRHAIENRLRQFIADASHELRTPLAGIRSHTELALRSSAAVPDGVRQALRRVEAESLRMGRLVDDLLLLARLDAGRPLADDPVDLSRLAIDATSDARAAGPDHRWLLDLPDEPVVVRGDEHRLHQVLANLLSNARTHTPPGSTVTVAVTRSPGQVELTVTDDGPGIPAELQPTVFERFVRGELSRSTSAGSTGLGLAIVSAVVGAHRGTATVHSRPGRTVFRIRLPAAVVSDARPVDQAATNRQH